MSQLLCHYDSLGRHSLVWHRPLGQTSSRHAGTLPCRLLLPSLIRVEWSFLPSTVLRNTSRVLPVLHYSPVISAFRAGYLRARRKWARGTSVARTRLPTSNTRRKATGGSPELQTPFEPHILRYEPSKRLRMLWDLAIKVASKHRISGFLNLCRL